jgi:hypothetical protein
LITECARKIEELLARSGEVNILSVCEHLAERSMVGYQSLGWLAHEGRIHYRKQGSQVYVSLEGQGSQREGAGSSPGTPSAREVEQPTGNRHNEPNQENQP